VNEKCCLIGPVLGTGIIEDRTLEAISPPGIAVIVRDPVDPDGYSRYPVIMYAPPPTIPTVSGAVT
jgi:hypothetical protein